MYHPDRPLPQQNIMVPQSRTGGASLYIFLQLIVQRFGYIPVLILNKFKDEVRLFYSSAEILQIKPIQPFGRTVLIEPEVSHSLLGMFQILLKL